ncbi:MAG: TonB-dependent receptor plug domain-containing protein, partial [Syntrophales bacterium]|nr:TonB-dependent receptor plug domain-containing protein [Syntrophales bacterium]
MRRNVTFGFALAAAVCGGHAAYAQTSQPQPAGQGQEEAEEIGEVIVTGSRIARQPSTLTAPLATLSAQEIQLSGAANLENLLNAQPQFIGAQTSRSNNPGTGAAQLDLRGLGSNRNLVLVNGRRYIYFSENQFTDINTIPSALVERVEIVTGGSSAVYGSDAIAGVTNFILRDDFEGMELRGQIGGDRHGDALTQSVDLTLGSNFLDGRGNVTVSFNH